MLGDEGGWVCQLPLPVAAAEGEREGLGPNPGALTLSCMAGVKDGLAMEPPVPGVMRASRRPQGVKPMPDRGGRCEPAKLGNDVLASVVRWGVAPTAMYGAWGGDDIVGLG